MEHLVSRSVVIVSSLLANIRRVAIKDDLYIFHRMIMMKCLYRQLRVLDFPLCHYLVFLQVRLHNFVISDIIDNIQGQLGITGLGRHRTRIKHAWYVYKL